MSKVILRHADLTTTQIYLGNVSDIEAIRWIENHGRHQRGSALYRDDCLEKSFPL